MFSNTIHSAIPLRLQKWKNTYFSLIIWHHGFWSDVSKFIIHANSGKIRFYRNLNRLHKTFRNRPKFLKFHSSIVMHQSHRILSCITARIVQWCGYITSHSDNRVHGNSVALYTHLAALYNRDGVSMILYGLGCACTMYWKTKVFLIEQICTEVVHRDLHSVNLYFIKTK